jgi:hypothetical protein
MKLLIKNFLLSDKVLKIRNLLNIRPVNLSFQKIQNSTSISDSFCWRTDNNFYSIFRYFDILRIFYNLKNTSVDIIFLSKNGKFIKKICLSKIDISNELKINKKFLMGKEDYGTFYIYHKTKEETKKNFLISNRCYTGYSQNNCLPSFVHGNSFSAYKSIYGNNKGCDLVKLTKKKNYYTIQKYFNTMDKVELFFSNPSSEKISFSVNNLKYSLNKRCCVIIDVTYYSTVTIISNCFYLRPIIFNYKKKYLDVHHG